MTDHPLASRFAVRHPEWAANATIYEVNVRNYTPEGTFRAFEAHLPRLAKMGVVIVWLMPIYPIGEVGRKGSLGSPYAVRDYLAVNPEFGTLEDLQHLVQTAHELGLKVILDWVANHTSRDNALIAEHPRLVPVRRPGPAGTARGRLDQRGRGSCSYRILLANSSSSHCWRNQSLESGLTRLG